MTTQSTTFTCAACKETFKRGWAEEEARAEFDQNFGGAPEDQNAVMVCDDCYEWAMALMRCGELESEAEP